MDLFTYPHQPGFKRRETSRAAAEAMKPSKARLQQLCLDMLRVAGPLTADECAANLARDKLSIRPRFSELSATGKIEDSGTRRRNASGKSAVVWQIVAQRIAA